MFFRVLLGVLGLLPLLAAAQAPEFETPVAVSGGTIITAPGAEPFAGVIVMEKGRITGVGTQVSLPPGTEVFDATGLYVYPGFIEGMTHDGVADAKLDKEAYGRLSDREQDERQGPRLAMQWANRKGIWPHAELVDLFQAGGAKRGDRRKAGITAAMYGPPPAILGGSAGLVLTSDQPLRRAVVNGGTFYVGSLRAYSDEGPAWGRRAYPNSAMGTAALLRQTFMDAEWYRASRDVALANPTAVALPLTDPVLEAVLAMKESGATVAFAADTADEIHHALDMAAELALKPVIVGGEEAWRVAGRLAAESGGVIASLEWPDKPKLAPDKKKEKEGAVYATVSWTADWEDSFFEPLRVREERVRLWEERVKNVQVLLDAGVRVSVMSPEDGPGKILEKLREAAEFGLTEAQALRVLTMDAAVMAGASAQAGEIAPGKLGNVTLMTSTIGDKESKIRAVFIGGERFEFELAGKDKKDDAKDDAEGEDDAPDGEADDEPEAAGDSGEAEADADEEGADEAGASEEKEDETPPADDHPWPSEIASDRTPRIETGGTVLLENATILTVTQGTLANADILIEGGKITAIGVDTAAPEGCARIDCTGYFIMPGIVDPHSHLAIRGGVNEYSESVTCEVRIADVVDHRDVGLWRALAGGVTTIHAMHGSANTIGGQTAVVKLKYDTSPSEMMLDDGPRLVKFALGENVTQANSSSRGQRFPVTRMGVEAVVREAFHDAEMYQQALGTTGDGVALPVRRDLRLQALSDILAGDIWIQSHCYRADEILRLLDVAEEYGVRVATLHHVLEGYRVLPEMYRLGVAGSTFSDWWAYKIEAAEAIPHNAAMMMAAGIVSSVNSDDAEVIRHMPLEAAKSMRFGGLTADEALKLCTINPARQIGRESRIGSIEVGKDGDVAIFDSHPLDTFSKCVLTVVEGEVYFQHRDFESGKAAGKAAFTPEPPRDPLPLAVDGAGRYAIVNATVHPVSGPAIPSGTVVVADGKIASVGTDPAPEGYTVVDGTGLHVYPGLINAATTLSLVEIERIEAVNDTTELAYLQPDVRASSAVNPFSIHVPITRVEGTTTALVVPSGGAVSGQASFIDLTGWSMPDMLRKDGVGLVLHLPTLPVFGPENKPDDKGSLIKTHREKIEEIEQYFRAAKHYGEARVAMEAAGESVVSNLRLDAMQPYVRGEKPVLFMADGYKHILECLSFAEAFGLKAIIVGGRDAWKCAAQLAEKQVPVIITSVFAYPATDFELYDGAYANAARLAEAGVTFCFGTHKPSSWEADASLSKLLPLHAGEAVAHGLDPERAVRALTQDAAAILGVADAVGTLEAGKVADIIVTTGHPCRANTRVVAEFIGGEPVDLLATAHEQNHIRFANRPAPDLPPAPEGLRGPAPMQE